MADKTNQTKRLARNALIPNVSKMDTEFGNEFVGDAKRVTHKVGTRVKTNSQRYGYFNRNDK
ncbi:MAG: hypothetical protein IJD87_00045 [Turicibacter sp.]|nr:hypothetical protein [Turicibacter sp.]